MADKVTARGGLQPKVRHRMWVGQDENTMPVYRDVMRDAIVEKKQRLIRTRDKTEAMSQHYIGILRPIGDVTAAGRRGPIDERDVFELPDGSTGPLLNWTGFVNGTTGKPYAAEVWLG